MNLFYTEQNGNVAGPIEREALQRLAQSGALSAHTQVCIEGSEDWCPLADILPRPTRVAAPITTKATSHNHSSNTKLPLIVAVVALIFSTVTAAKVFWPKPSITKYSFTTPQDAIQSIIALTQHGTWDDWRELQKHQSKSPGTWSYELLDKNSVEIHKTLEVTDSIDKKKNGNIICFLRLKCPDGVTRYSTTVFKKANDGDFLSSSYPRYSSSDYDDITANDRRLTELIMKWETTGALSE